MNFLEFMNMTQGSPLGLINNNGVLSMGGVNPNTGMLTLSDGQTLSRISPSAVLAQPLPSMNAANETETSQFGSSYSGPTLIGDFPGRNQNQMSEQTRKKTSLLDRFKKTLQHVDNFDVLVGYFRTSGFYLLYKELEKVKNYFETGKNVSEEIVEINKKDTKSNPIWLMRQAGRYLPEFREIRKENQDFIKLCLNSDLASEITLQPIKRFGFDGAVIFSDILMLPYGLNQKVEFEKNFGPKLGNLNLDDLKNIDEVDFSFKLNSVYKAINITSNKINKDEKDLIGFVGAPWTILVYMINKISPKKKLKEDFFKDEFSLVISTFFPISSLSFFSNSSIFEAWSSNTSYFSSGTSI